MIDDERIEELLRNADVSPPGPGETPRELAGRVRTACARRRRRRTFWVRIGSLAGAYLAGLLTFHAWQTAAPTLSPPPTSHAETSANNKTLRKTRESKSDGEGPENVIRRAPREVAIVRMESTYQRLRRLGDEYLNVRGDVATALELYRRALEEASPDEFAVSEQADSWLLRSLKEDRLASNRRPTRGDAL